MMEKQIKSRDRVNEHGEVFTPSWVVDLMLDDSVIAMELENLQSTFLEPAAGEGAFLVEILSRKLSLAKKLSKSVEEFEENILIALMSIYGIELLEDNLELLVMNLYSEFITFYYDYLQETSSQKDNAVLNSARTIISANMANGNSLTGLLANDSADIIFSEWTILPVKYGVRKVQRTEYTFNSIKEQGGPLEGVNTNRGQVDLLAGFFEDEESEKPSLLKYEPVKLKEVFKEKLIDAN